MDERDVLNLKTRYLVWLYKTTKDAFDKYERKFTQLDIDEMLLAEIEKELKASYQPSEGKALEKFANEFRVYIGAKENQSLKLKYKGKKLNPEFLFLDVKLQAIEKIMAQVLGKDTLEAIKENYQQEMLLRILQAKEVPAGKK